MRDGLLPMAVFLAVCLLAAAEVRAQETATIEATNDGLVVDGYRLVFPGIVHNERLGSVTVTWSNGEGEQETIENARPEDVKPRWLNIRTKRFHDGDYQYRSTEYLEALVEWWSKGGRGNYWVAQDGKLLSHPPAPRTPTPAGPASNDSPAQGSVGGPFSEDAVINPANVPRVP